VVFGDVLAVLVTQQVLGEDFEAVREFLGIGDGIETIDLVTVVADLEVSLAPNEFTESLLVTSTPED